LIKGEGGEKKKEKRKVKELLTFTDGERRMREHENEGARGRRSRRGREGCRHCGCAVEGDVVVGWEKEDVRIGRWEMKIPLRVLLCFYLIVRGAGYIRRCKIQVPRTHQNKEVGLGPRTPSIDATNKAQIGHNHVFPLHTIFLLA